MYWDGGTRPAVEAPLGDFFAADFGLRREGGLLGFDSVRLRERWLKKRPSLRPGVIR
jgi:hypothetical protein